MKSLLNMLLIVLTVVAPCTVGATTIGDDVRTNNNRVVYEVFVRNFSQSSKLSAVTEALPRLKALGVDVVWLMPIYKGGDKDKWGTYSSPYAVKNYKMIDPLYGTDDDLKNLVNAAHEQGMEIWLDWVANHTSTDAVWTTEHPEFYGSKFTKPNGWSDVYQLDYTNQEMRAAMIDALKYWVQEFDIDGYRCDYADGVPRDFWKQAREAVDEVKHITWLAESAGEGNYAKLVSEVFDYNYAWAFNDRLLEGGTKADCAETCASAAFLLHNARDKATYSGDKSRLVYLSNHDVVQDKKGTPDKHFGQNVNAMTVLMFTAYGMPLLYNGQEINWSTGQVLLAEKSVINWNRTDPAMTELITKLADLKHRTPVLNAGTSGGDFIHHSTGAFDNSVLVFERRKGTESLVVMLNFGTTEANIELNTLPAAEYKEFFTDATADFATQKQFTLPAKGYAVWSKTDDKEIEPLYHYIYIEDATGWPAFNIYGWNGNYTEFFGVWPGSAAAGTRVLQDGVEHKMWQIPQTWWGQNYHLIFNSGSRQLPDYDFALNRDIFLKVTASGVQEKTNLAVHEVSIEGTEVSEYYNLQGMKVVKPEPGQIYICRKGNTMRKIIF